MNCQRRHGNDNIYRLLDQLLSHVPSQLWVSAGEIGFEHIVVRFGVAELPHPFAEALQIAFHRLRKPTEKADLRLLSSGESWSGHRQSGARKKDELTPRRL